ncbi:MAG: ester cyclase [Candidatus Kariarchaeaceae archaeon]|jgi:predicted ester cyclase
MSLDENKAVVRSFIEAYNKRNLDLLDDIIAPDYFDHTHQQQGVESVKQVLNRGFKGFPDWYEAIEDIIAEGDKVWVRLTYTGTHTGEFFGLPPTGKKITAMAVGIYRVINGKLVEGRFITDAVDLFKQTGAIEITEKGKTLFL